MNAVSISNFYSKMKNAIFCCKSGTNDHEDHLPILEKYTRSSPIVFKFSENSFLQGVKQSLSRTKVKYSKIPTCQASRSTVSISIHDIPTSICAEASGPEDDQGDRNSSLIKIQPDHKVSNSDILEATSNLTYCSTYSSSHSKDESINISSSVDQRLAKDKDKDPLKRMILILSKSQSLVYRLTGTYCLNSIYSNISHNRILRKAKHTDGYIPLY